MSGLLAVLVVVGIVATGHHHVWWGPEPPRDPEVLVLRIQFVEGMGSQFRPVPDISVYGDGRVLTTATEFAEFRFREVVKDQQLTRLAYRRVYRDAHLAGLAKSRSFDSDAQWPDAGPTVVTLMAGDRQHVSTVAPGASGARVWLIERLADHLRSLPRSDLVRPPVTYSPTRTAMVAWQVGEHSSESSPHGGTQVTQWPLSPIAADRQPSCTLLRGTDAEAVARLAGSASPDTRWRSGAHLYTMALRPLLPDETDCTAVIR
jgi:hypothetical protein